MKIVLPTSPTFAPAASGSGSLNFTTTGLSTSFDIRRLFAVINQTRNVLIYAETVTGLGYTAWNNTTKVLTLQADTSLYSSIDSLQVIYDDPNATVAITSLPSLPAGSSAIGSVTVSNLPATQPISATALPLPTGAATNTTLTDGTQKTQVTSLPALPAGSNAIGTVEITNDVGNAIPISAASLPLPTGAATSAGILDVRNILSEQFYEFGSITFTGVSQSFVVTTGGSGLVQCQSMTAMVPATYFFAGSIVVQGSLDNITFSNLPLYNLQTNTTTSSITSFGEPYQFNTSGLIYIRFLTSTWSTGTGQIIYKRSQQPSRSAGGGSVSVSNFPATQAVSGTVEITNDVGNAIPVSAAALPLPAGASTEATLLALKNAYLNGTVNTFSINASFPSHATTVTSAGCLVFYVSGSFPSGASFFFESSVDYGTSYVAVPFVNLVTGASATSVSGTGSSITLLVAVSAVGISNIRVNSSGTLTASTLSFKSVASEKTVGAASSGAASSVSVTNFPATQPVSGTVSLGAGANAIGTVEITNDAGNAIPVSGTVSLGAGANAIGTVEITNDVGNPIPISAAALPLPSGAATEATLLALKNAYLNTSVTSSAMSSVATFVSMPCSNSGSTICYITGNWAAGVSITVDSSIDGISYVSSVPFVNLLTGASVTSLAGTGSTQTYLIAASSVGLQQLRLNSSGTWGGTSATVKFCSSEKTVGAASGGSASSVSVTNFPATQAVSGTVAISNTNTWSVIVDNQLVPTGTAGFLNIPTRTTVCGLLFNLSDINDTGYGFETVYLKIYVAPSAPTVGTTPPALTIPISSGSQLLEQYEFPAPGWKFGTNNVYMWTTKNFAASDSTPTASTLRVTVLS